MTSLAGLSQPKGIPILMYHALVEGERTGGIGSSEDPVYSIEKEQFEAHIRQLTAKGYESILLRDVITRISGKGILPPKSVMITFDDGHVSNLTLAIPILEKHKCHAEFFITTGYVGKPGYLDRKQIKSLQKAGMGIGSHTVSHPMLDELEPSRIQEELGDSKKFLEELLGEEVIGLSVPGGRINSTVRAIAHDAGYRTILTSKSGVNGRGQDLFNLKRIPVRRSTLLSGALLQQGYDGIGSRIIQGIFDGGKALLGNQRYECLRNRLVRSSLEGRVSREKR
ncbi:MAG: polysaccharide deacetylase family protein [Armatimonadota bacterium]